MLLARVQKTLSRNSWEETVIEVLLRFESPILLRSGTFTKCKDLLENYLHPDIVDHIRHRLFEEDDEYVDLELQS
jgi:hypothetical protein